ncbi:MAG: signal peptidase I [Pirellulales bacterium]
MTLAFLYIVWKPFVSEAFVIPTNAMAPTLLGLHQEDACPECGSIAYFSRPEPILPEREQPPINMICERFHVHPAPSTSKPIDVGDRIVVAKYLKPRRWDLIVFRFPADATQTYVKRLVGLPGEEVVVKDGNVWADGRRLEPPAELAGIEYLNAFPEEEFGPHIKVAGTEDNPARLGDDEYFVLGDFSAQSYDSRLWMEGAAGHPPYSVPHENLIGVVTTIYWPRERWRSFR